MSRISSLWEGLRSGFWFIPGLLVFGAVVLFAITHQIDRVVDASLSELPLIFSGGATAARSLLSTIAGSLIAVVATVFSLTIVALQLASTSYSPRILRNFVADRGVQIVLGAYIGTFTYSLLLLRILRTPESQKPAFIPVISVTLAVILTLLCVGLLVYFIHHIASMIQSSTIVQSAHQDAMRTIDSLDDLEETPVLEAQDPEKHSDFRGLLDEGALVIHAQKSGYVQSIDVGSILKTIISVTSTEKVVVEVPHGPGFFVAAGLPSLYVWPKPEGNLGEKAIERLHGAFVYGKERSFNQDFAFGLRQLEDIALKGVSPGVNDPTTSMQAMDRIEAILVALGKKALPLRVREQEVDGIGVLLKVGHYGFDDVVGLAFDQLRRACFTSGQVAVLERLLEVIERALWANDLPGRKQALWERAFAVGRLAPSQISDPHDAASLTRRAVMIGASLMETELGASAGPDLEELLGLSEDLPGGEDLREVVARGVSSGTRSP